MYLKRIEIENNGPIEYLNYELPFDDESRPKPVVFVGQNGTGKSILLSHIVNAMISAKSAVYKDTEVEKGMVYKLRSASYISHRKDFYRAYMHFENNFHIGEIQASLNRKQFEDVKGYTPADKHWNNIQENGSSVITTDFFQRETELRDILSEFTLLYFPPNRFEEPAWLNTENLRNVTNYASARRIQGISNRQIINSSPLRDNQSWLLDVIYDSFAIERRFQMAQLAENISVPVLVEQDGPATSLRAAIERFVLTLLRADGNVNWSVGPRGRRSISISANSKPIASNLFSLSTGQTALLNIFLTLIRDCDTSDAGFSTLEGIRGLVVIDEIDVHLHTELQHTILPEIIALFPRVQFVLTSHSPLFILGLTKRLGNDGFSLIELPTGNSISVERFSEFEAAYEHFKESARFEDDVRSAIIESQTPIVFAEGSIDVDYISHAASLLGRQASLEKCRLLDGNGFGGLDKIWKHFDANIAQLTNRRVTLLYDCDVNKTAASKPGVNRHILPRQDHRIAKGIENLFPDELIQKAKHANEAFIDVTPAYQRTVRATVIEEPERWDVNPDEKRNLADWILQHGVAADFSNFAVIFDLLDQVSTEANSS
ncbi:AAA family ATPase [Sinorhizobium psoraleae]|uniref:AAA family ATPase n=1 Tax=Sinorhizobium psoraleae TaxID=520838 RepID=A0ABT4KF60_9HYPH|nr:AAA family ATPase [Sinorhizobium psoraleae]MCZ4090606.1 AAA family ATPase [Sinorhizobium psoraleae]